MKLTGSKYHKYSAVGPAIILIAVIYLITLGFLEKRGFWIADNANKFIQLQAILNSNYSGYSIPWPGSAVDPDFEYNPLPHPFSVIKDHNLFSIYSPIFATASSLFFKICGFQGLYILPFVFSMFLLFGLVRMLNTVGSEKAVKNHALFIAGLCTPIWFYSVVFWEHIIAASLCVWGCGFCLDFLKSGSRKHLIFGAATSTFSIYFRDELYLFCAVLLVAVLLYNSKERLKTALIFIFCVIISAMPLWLFQWKTIGQPLGFHVQSYLFSGSGIAPRISDRPLVLYNLFAASSESIWLSLALTMPFIVVFLLNPKLSEKSFKVAVPLYCLIALSSSVFILHGYFSSDSPIAFMSHSNSLFTSSPILILAFMRYRNPKASEVNLSLRKWIWFVALAYAIVYGLTAPQLGSTGIHWGNRFLLVLYPLFTILCVLNLAEWHSCFNRRIGWQKVVITLTILISLGAQVYSLNLLRKKKAFCYHLNREIQKRTEEVIVTNVWWVPQELCLEFYNKSIFFVRSWDQYYQLTSRLSRQGYKKLLLVGRVSEKRLHSGVIKVSDGGLNLFDLAFQVVYIDDSRKEMD